MAMCALGIAFDPKDQTVQQGADVIIRRKDLREILPHLFPDLGPS